MDLPELLLHPRPLQHLPHGLAGNPPVLELGQDHPPDLGVFLVHTDGSSDHEVLTGIPGWHTTQTFPATVSGWPSTS